MDAQPVFVRREMIAAAPAPRAAAGGMAMWLRQRLFSSVLNSLLTILSAVVLAALIVPAVRFLLIDAVWTGSSREDCTVAGAGRAVGACWPFIAAKFRQFMYGFYPAEEQWRVNLTYAIGAILLIPLLIPRAPYKIVNAIAFFGVFPLLAFFLLVGGRFGLAYVETRLWGGLLVT